MCIMGVSPELVKPRSEVGLSSLMPPSGAYLAWQELHTDAGLKVRKPSEARKTRENRK